MSAPVVSVVLPVFNAAAYLHEALDSLCTQTFAQFEIVLVDDASTDNSRLIAETYAQKDARLNIIANTQGKGLAGALNSGLEAAAGDYIARMDADDISLPSRLEKQLAFMQAHPDIALCGTGIHYFGAGPALDVLYPLTHEQIFCRMLFVNPLAHPTVLWRREVFLRAGLRYDPTSHAEDYDLWERSAQQLQLANLPDVLLRYRISPASFTHVQNEKQGRSVAEIFARQLARLAVPTDDATLQLHRMLSNEAPLEQPQQLRRARAHILQLWQGNRRCAYYPAAAFRATLLYFWQTACLKYRGEHRLACKLYPCRELDTGTAPPDLQRPVQRLLTRLHGWLKHR